MTQELTEVLRASEARTGIPSWLSGVSVVAVGDSIPLATAVGVLSQFGAALTRIAKIDDVPTSADIVLVDRIEDGDESLGGPVEYLRRVDDLNRSVWVTASAYGLGDPRVTAKASEVTLLAAGGILGHTPGPDGLPPTIPAGDVAFKLVGDALVMAALHGLHEFRSGGRPVHVDLSGQGAVIATGLALEMSHALNDCPSEGGTARYGAPTGFFPCVDGSVYVLLLEQHQWVGFRGVMGNALDHIETIDEAAERAAEVNAVLARWTSVRTAAECESALQDAGVPATTVHTIESFLTAAEVAGRQVSMETPLPAAIQLYDEAAEPRGYIPLQELKILDAGHVLAVPLSASWLGAMGAQVTKVEDPKRLDIYRRRGPFAGGLPGLNRSAYFNHLNFNKRGVDIDVNSEGSSCDIGPFDVIMHNQSPHRAALLGVTASSVGRAAGGPKLSLTSSGFGRTGAWQDYRAYGTTIHAFAGLIAATQNARGDMSGIGTPWADPLCSVAATIWVLAWSLAPAKERSMSVDISMAECLAAHLMDQIGVASDRNYLPSQFGGDFFLLLPASGAQLAITIKSAQDAKVFADVVGAPVPEVTRRGQRFDLPQGHLSSLTGQEIERRLQAAGLRASLVYDASSLARDRRLFDSEVFQFVTSSALGRYAVAGIPWAIVGKKKPPLAAAPERP
jgi:crotonobetainyl-CoA:carnitine CoA-transferase CaiB-like acyl-CoA transferase